MYSWSPQITSTQNNFDGQLQVENGNEEIIIADELNANLNVNIEMFVKSEPLSQPQSSDSDIIVVPYNDNEMIIDLCSEDEVDSIERLLESSSEVVDIFHNQLDAPENEPISDSPRKFRSSPSRKRKNPPLARDRVKRMRTRANNKFFESEGESEEARK